MKVAGFLAQLIDDVTAVAGLEGALELGAHRERLVRSDLVEELSVALGLDAEGVAVDLRR